MIRSLIVLGALIALSGCAPDIQAWGDALKADPAPACVRWTWVYGSGELSRYHGCDKP